MKPHYIDTVNVIIDGDNCKVLNISGTSLKYSPDIVKETAISKFRATFPNSKFTAVIIQHKEVDLVEYKDIMTTNLPWFEINN